MDENQEIQLPAPEPSDLPNSQGDSFRMDGGQINPEEKGKFENFVGKYGIPISILVGLTVIAVSIYLSFGLPNQRAAKSNAVAGEITPPPPPDAFSPATADDDPVLGNPDARVTLIEFSDFQCPFCRKLWRETLPEIKKNYIDTGKAKLVYRDFPLSSIHPAAQSAAEAGECADDQGKFWQMHDKIYSEQDKQGQGTVQFSVSDIKKWAGQIGLSMSEFNNCLDSQKYKAEVEKDTSDGQVSGITGTPGTFVDGTLIKGAVSYAVFSQAIEEALKK